MMIVKRFFDLFSNAYMRLGRFHTMSGLWVSSIIPPLAGMLLSKPPVLKMIFLSIVILICGACIRAAACSINDLYDVDVDKQVKRTKDRPIASGELSQKQGLMAFLAFSALPLIVVLFTNITTIYISAIAAFLIILYPLAKRVLHIPQIFLGLTTSMGVLIGYSMVTGNISIGAVMLYCGFVFWTVAFDTVYSHQDIEDDLKANVNSAAVYYGKSSKARIRAFFFAALMFWVSAGILVSLSVWFFALMLVIALMFLIQYKIVNLDNPKSCASMFRVSVFVGFILTLAVLVGVYF